MAYADLRQFLSRLAEEGQLHRVRADVDWNLELSHIAKLNEEQGGPALLFENIKGYPGQRVLTSLYTTKERVALALGLDPGTRHLDISRHWVERIQNRRIPPEYMSPDLAPIRENVQLEDAVDLDQFATPWFYPRDGGRYIGTAAFLLTRDPDTGRVNLGTYRAQILGKNRVGLQLIKGKDGEMDLRKWRKLGRPMPAALVIGGPPELFLVGSTLFPVTESEYDVAGALRGGPVPVVPGVKTDLPIPATAEIVLEGYVPTGDLHPEGPFGEYTGYYSGKGVVERDYLQVTAVSYRNDPILWSTTVGKPVTDTHMVMSINRTASLWNDLMAMKIPGIKAVYSPPASAGRMLAIIAVEQMYPGHSTQVGLAAFASVTGNYGLKTVILVDEDIDPENMEQVMYALSFRFQPNRGTQILERGRSTPLDPSLAITGRDLTSRVILDTCIPWEWKEKPIPITLDAETVAKVKSRWEEYFPERLGARR